jgi:hypothetical protein
MRGLMVLGAVLVVLWLAGVIFFKVVGFAIHLLLIAGVILLVLAVVRRGGDAVRRRL